MKPIGPVPLRLKNSNVTRRESTNPCPLLLQELFADYIALTPQFQSNISGLAPCCIMSGTPAKAETGKASGTPTGRKDYVAANKEAVASALAAARKAAAEEAQAPIFMPGRKESCAGDKRGQPGHTRNAQPCQETKSKCLPCRWTACTAPPLYINVMLI